MNLNKLILFLLLISLSCIYGCGRSNTVIDYKNMTEKERIIYLHENYYIPLKKNYYELIYEYKNASKSSKTIEEFHQVTIPLWKKKYGPYINDLHKTIPPIDSKEMQSIYPYFSCLEISLFSDAFDLLNEMKDKAKYQKDLKGNIKNYNTEIDKSIIELFEEDDLIYQNEYSKAIYGNKTFELTYDNYKKLNNGMTPIEVTRIFKMPPTIYELSNEDDTIYYYWILEADDHIVYFIEDLKPSDEYIRLTFKQEQKSYNYKMIVKENFGIK